MPARSYHGNSRHPMLGPRLRSQSIVRVRHTCAKNRRCVRGPRPAIQAHIGGGWDHFPLLNVANRVHLVKDTDNETILCGAFTPAHYSPGNSLSPVELRATARPPTASPLTVLDRLRSSLIISFEPRATSYDSDSPACPPDRLPIRSRMPAGRLHLGAAYLPRGKRDSYPAPIM